MPDNAIAHNIIIGVDILKRFRYPSIENNVEYEIEKIMSMNIMTFLFFSFSSLSNAEYISDFKVNLRTVCFDYKTKIKLFYSEDTIFVNFLYNKEKRFEMIIR